MATTGVPAVNIDGTTIHTSLNTSIGSFDKNLQPLGNKIRSSLRKKLSDRLIIIADEISMVSNDFLF